MGALEKLAQSAKNRHGRQLQPDEVAEIVEIIQGTQYRLIEETARNEALVRVAVVAVNAQGGRMLLSPEDYDDIAPQFGVTMEWNDEEDVIYVETYKVEVSDVRPEDGADEREIDGDLAPVSGEHDGAQMQLALEEDEEG